VILRHRDCGGEIDSHRYCSKCGQRLTARESMAAPGFASTRDRGGVGGAG